MDSDSFVALLNDQGYNPIALPREKFDPLTILVGSRPTDLQAFGTIEDLVVAGTRIPEITVDDSAPGFSDRRVRSADARAGLNLLDRLLASLGVGGASASAAYANAADVDFVYNDVKHDFVYPARIGPVFAFANLQKSVMETIAGFPLAYVVTDTLKSGSFGVVALDGHGASIDVNVDAIRNSIGARAGVKVEAGNGSTVSYSGSAPLRFAFRALRLLYDAKLEKIILRIDPSFKIAKAVDTSFDDGSGPGSFLPDDGYEVLAPNQAIEIDELAAR